jgi:hypothetical protein
MKAQVGDWVRFYQNGELVVGVVQYTTRTILGHVEYNTDRGVVSDEYVLEVRKAKA